MTPSRRDVLLRTGMLASLVTLGLSTRSFAASAGDALAQLASGIDPLTRALRGQSATVDDWRQGLDQIFSRIDLDDLLVAMDFDQLAARTGYAERGVATAPLTIRSETGASLSFLPKMFAVGAGRAIVPHGHNNMVSAHLTLSGRFRLRQYDTLTVEEDALIIRPSADRIAVRGDLSSIGTTTDNVHWFRAIETAHTLDIIVLGLEPSTGPGFDIYNLDIDRAEQLGGDRLRAARISVPDALRLYG